MKTSTLLLILLVFNSSILLSQFANWLLAVVNPVVMVGSEILLLFGYFVHNTVKAVRAAFDIDFQF